jgi:hypothetical protein
MILADAEWLQEVFQQHFTGMDVFRRFMVAQRK